MRARLMALAATLVLTACSPTPSAGDGDCAARVRLYGDNYRPVAGLQTPHRGERVGAAPYLDCEGDTEPGLGDAEVFTVRGQDASRLVIVAEEDGDAVYMNDTIPWRERPQLVKDAERYVKCSGPARFVGAWRFVEPEDMPNGEDYASARVPYIGNFSTRKGTGVRLERWAQVTLQAEITGDTEPVPSAQFLERATGKNVPVTVTTSCREGTFQVETIRFVR